MAKVTILGSGITGLTIASLLPKHYSVTIVASNLPSDTPSKEWASPWACAGWVALGGTPREEQMQLDTLAFFRKLALSNPESSIRCGELIDVHDDGLVSSAEEVWCRGRVPGFRELSSEDGKGGLRVAYTGAVMNPGALLPWLRGKLEEEGVKFRRVGKVGALKNLEWMGHDILINASGVGSMGLEDVEDTSVITDRTYTILVRTEFDKTMFVKRSPGHEYLYVFGRGDGTVVVGGISDPVGAECRGEKDVRENLIRRAHESLPEQFPSRNPGDYTILGDLTGIRPLRLPGVRVEKEVIGEQKVVHAYGTTIGAYMLSFGIAREVARLVDEFVFEL